MILKRLEKNNKIKAMYSSATICASTFDTNTRDLIIIFKNGGQYKYPNVELTDYTRFETADSNGTTFNTYIKKKYTNFEKLDKVDVSVILKEIDELKAAEDKTSSEVKSKLMMVNMANLISLYITTGKINEDILKKLETNISDYNKVAESEPINIVN